MKRFFYFLLLCVLFIRCNNKEAELPVYELTPIKEIDIIGDTLLFTSIRCLTFHENKIYFSNPVYDHIVCLDKDLNLVNMIGKKGKGANELLSIYHFSIEDSLIFLINSGNRRINIFSTAGMPVSEEIGRAHV